MKNKYLLFIVFLFWGRNSFAQTTGSFTVGGDFEKFYPVIFEDNGWDINSISEIQISRSNIHENSGGRGALISKFRYHVTRWGHGASFIEAEIHQVVNRFGVDLSFIAGWKDASGVNAGVNMIIWLRGGGTTYHFNSIYNNTPTVFDGVANLLPFQETNGPSHSYKTEVDAYVNSSGTNATTAYFTGERNNFFKAKVGIGTNFPSAQLEIASGPGTTTFKALGSNAYLLVNNVGSGETYYQADKAHRFQGLSGSEIFTMLGTGNIGIGTATPSDLLSVNGKIRAREIKVENDHWPDYVFSKSYPLPSLQETEQHIKEKGHLPGIPSAAEVKTNGIDLGEMNAKLLQKIEELTLHLIEQNKMIKSQQKEINALKTKKDVE